MATSNARIESETLPAEAGRKRKALEVDKGHDDSLERTVNTEPKLHSWMIVAAGAVVPLGLAVIAATTTYVNKNERVAIAAWVAVAVVGSASVISSAAVSHRRIVSLNHDHQGTKATERSTNR